MQPTELLLYSENRTAAIHVAISQSNVGSPAISPGIKRIRKEHARCFSQWKYYQLLIFNKLWIKTDLDIRPISIKLRIRQT